jgi:hypothetical protein
MLLLENSWVCMNHLPDSAQLHFSSTAQADMIHRAASMMRVPKNVLRITQEASIDRVMKSGQNRSTFLGRWNNKPFLQSLTLLRKQEGTKLERFQDNNEYVAAALSTLIIRLY